MLSFGWLRVEASFSAAPLVAALTLAGVTGCSSCKKADSFADADYVDRAEPPVSAPARLLVEAFVSSPNALWTRVQRGVGGAAMLLPSTFAGLLCTLAGLDPAVAFEVDGAAPAFIVLADEAGGGETTFDALPPFAVAMKLLDSRHTRNTVFGGDGAAPAGRYASKDVGGMHMLVPKNGPASYGAAITAGGYLVVARSEADLARLGPYAYRTLPTKTPAPGLEVDVPFAALSGPLRARLAAAWATEKRELVDSDANLRVAHDAGAADFGDAPAIVAALDAVLQRRLEILGDLEQARLTLDATDDSLDIDVEMKPLAGGGPATQALDAMHPGDTSPLLDAPLGSALALMLRDDASGRASDAEDVAAAVARTLGPRLGDDDAKQLRAGLGDWAKGHGDWTTLALSASPSYGITLRAPAVDNDAASHGLRELLDLAARPAFKEPLKAYLGMREMTFATTSVPGAGKVTVATIVRNPRPPLSFAWTTTSGEVRAAVSETATDLVAPPAKAFKKLGDDPGIARSLAALGESVSFALVAQPLRAGRKRKDDIEPGPIVLAWGKRDGHAWGRFEITFLLAKELARALLGL